MGDQAHGLREFMKAQSLITTQPPQKNNTRVITVASGKGGVGKTNISANLALSLAAHGKNVVLMDADLGLANINVVLGVMPEYNLYHLLRKQKRLEDVLLQTDYGLRIVAGASGFSKIANLQEEERAHIFHELIHLSFADIIIIDLSAGVSQNVISFIEAAGETIIVTTPEPTAITDAYGIVKIIATDAKMAKQNLQLVVNRVKTVTEARRVAERFQTITANFLNLKMNYLGYVYDDNAVPYSVLKQKPFVVGYPKCKASLCIHQIAQRLGRFEDHEQGGVKHFFRKLLGQDKKIVVDAGVS